MFTTKLIAKSDIAEGTMAFYFEKPAGFEFTAGQYADFTHIHPPISDAEGNKRSFSIASAPHEKDIVIASRMRDTAFKRVLKGLSPGAEIEMSGPMGSFTLHLDAAKPAVFLAGGIGITPFFSMVKDAAHRKLPHRIVLFYSNKRPEDSAFLQELTDLQKENSNYTLVATMTEMDKSKQPWSGETGFINAAMLNKYLYAKRYTLNAIYYIAGPPAMVAAMRRMLEEAGVNPDIIRTEEFSGY